MGPGADDLTPALPAAGRVPAEEQLRVLSQQPAGAPLPAAARTQLEMHLKQLTASYAEIKQNAAE